MRDAPIAPVRVDCDGLKCSATTYQCDETLAITVITARECLTLQGREFSDQGERDSGPRIVCDGSQVYVTRELGS